MNKTTDEVLEIASQLLESWLWSTETSRPEPNRLDAKLSLAEDLIPIVVGLRVQRIGYLAAITGLDHGPERNIIEVLYHFCTGEAIVTLRVDLPRENPVISSLCEVIPGAESFEREAKEMFGITFEGLRNPEKLYLPDNWPEKVYPLRKDFDIQALSAQAPEESTYG